MKELQLNKLPFNYALVIKDNDIKFSFPDESKLIRSEKSISATSDKPFFKTLGGVTYFVKQSDDIIDAVFATAFNASSLKQVELVLSAKKVRYLLFKVTRPNYNFFDKAFSGQLTNREFVGVLNDRTNYDIFFIEHENMMYVLIEKN